MWQFAFGDDDKSERIENLFKILWKFMESIDVCVSWLVGSFASLFVGTIGNRKETYSTGEYLSMTDDELLFATATVSPMLQQFMEGQINVQVPKREQRYHKKRVPAWCDRILWATPPHPCVIISQSLYECKFHELKAKKNWSQSVDWNENEWVSRQNAKGIPQEKAAYQKHGFLRFKRDVTLHILKQTDTFAFKKIGKKNH
ncbi:hypothetical protein RFI_18172 [Reticulomyxa filosa]|uniref:Inositol polyphosphate-related phosphatase domain-containing protein n=1 Tax=Reticulomyxa filosa TaxID=46433 RepID=X6N160_RETFI|nr:hypothetical protein RFI_18172 [Reticulomyxa filosa]|eukprot:ETO19067.1 hypothetical protein RFI_18172 [Reticulomyxa filosa]